MHPNFVWQVYISEKLKLKSNMQKPLQLWLNHTLFDDHFLYLETLKTNQFTSAVMIILKESFCNCFRLRSTEP